VSLIKIKPILEDGSPLNNINVIEGTYGLFPIQQFKKTNSSFGFSRKLPYRCTRLHGIKNDMVVYDPFMGIGSTALACLSLDIDYIGTEIDKEYIDIAEKI